jgi:microcystin-dependent protein
MASTYTNRLGLEKQGDGENPNSWGSILNTNVIDLIDDAIAGYEVVSVSSTGITLSDNNGTADQSRNAALEFAGTLTANVTITIPSEEKTYFVRENTTGSFAVQMKTAAGSALTLSQQSNIFIACDGTDIYSVEAPTSVSAFTVNVLTATSITTSILAATSVSASAITVSGNVSATEFYGGGSNLTGIVPSGSIFPYGGTSEPLGYLFCYGQEINRITYSDLFSAIGTTYGTGDGSTTFNLPDIRGRVVAGKDDMGGSSANRLTGQTGGVDGDVLGGAGGGETVTLLDANMPSGVGIDSNLLLNESTVDNAANSLVPTSSYPSYPKVATVSASDTTVFDSSGSDTPANIVQPTLILNYIIKT